MESAALSPLRMLSWPVALARHLNCSTSSLLARSRALLEQLPSDTSAAISDRARRQGDGSSVDHDLWRFNLDEAHAGYTDASVCQLDLVAVRILNSNEALVARANRSVVDFDLVTVDRVHEPAVRVGA